MSTAQRSKSLQNLQAHDSDDVSNVLQTWMLLEVGCDKHLVTLCIIKSSWTVTPPCKGARIQLCG